jgi:hypothetical protein
MHFLFGVLIFLYFVLRSSARAGYRGVRRSDVFDQGTRAFGDLASQYGGNASVAGWRKLLYVTQDRTVELQLNADSRRLVLRLRRPFDVPFSFYRVPRLMYAFLDAFLQPSLKVEGTHYLVGSRNSERMTAIRDRNGFVPVLQKLDQAGFSGQTTSYGLKLWKTVRPEELNDVAIMGLIRLAQDLAHVCDRDLVNIPVQPLSSEKRCAYCKEVVSEIDPAQYCQWCGTPHHKECFELNGRCTVFGCERPIPQSDLYSTQRTQTTQS